MIGGGDGNCLGVQHIRRSTSKHLSSSSFSYLQKAAIQSELRLGNNAGKFSRKRFGVIGGLGAIAGADVFFKLIKLIVSSSQPLIPLCKLSGRQPASISPGRWDQEQLCPQEDLPGKGIPRTNRQFAPV